jgi:hypothetical protein
MTVQWPHFPPVTLRSTSRILLLATVVLALSASIPGTSRSQVCSGTSAPTLTSRAFADAVFQYAPVIKNGEPTEKFRSPETAIGADDYAGDNTCTNPCKFVSLGDGGNLTLRFGDNVLTGSGTSSCDLWIYEVGPDVENTYVEISRDGTTWNSVGMITGATKGIDLDAYGFATTDSFYFVRLTDDAAEGGQTGASVGADIDAVGAVTSMPVCTIDIVLPEANLAPGDVVTITGAGFEAGAVVTFGDIPAAQTSVISTPRVTATVPAIAAGGYLITVTMPDHVACSYAQQVVAARHDSWGSLKAIYR